MTPAKYSSVFHSYPLGNDLKMAELVSLGLPAGILRHLAVAFGVQPSGIAPYVNISEKTILRRLGAKGSSSQTSQSGSLG